MNIRSFPLGRLAARAALCLVALALSSPPAVSRAVEQAAGPDAAAPLPALLMDMEECVRYGLSHNPGVMAAEFALRRGDADVRAAFADFLPRVDSGYQLRRVRQIHSGLPPQFDEDRRLRPVDTDSDSFDEDAWYLRLSQPLFAGFTITNTHLRSRLTRDIIEAELEHIRLETARDIRESYLRVLLAQEDRRSLEASVVRLESQLEAAQAFFRLGLKPWLGVLQAEADLNEARQNLAQMENAVRVHTARLLTLMGLPTDTALEPAGGLAPLAPEFPLSLEECQAEAARLRPDVIIARKAVEVAETDVHLAWGRFSPTVSLDASYHLQDKSYRDELVAQRNDLSNREYWTVGVGVRMNLFEGGRSQAMLARARHELSRFRAQMLQRELDAAYDVEAAYLLLHEAKNRIASSVKVREAAQEAYDMALVRYRTEIGTHTELLDAQERLTRAETRSNQARAEYDKAKARLFFAMGWLEAKL